MRGADADILQEEVIHLMDEKFFLDSFIEEWKSGGEQMDDVMVIGIKL